jgi:DeoR/GlpR family transcriptional regulator of sugar metabolism
MFQELIKIIQAGHLHSTSELAIEMGVSEEIVRQLIEQLEKRDYLQAAGGNCLSQLPSCSQCHAIQQCHLSSKKWVLTTKGKRLADSA